MRIMSVIGALALACLCLASPSIAASPTDHLTYNVISHELRVAQPIATEFAAVVNVFDLTAPMIAIASTTEPDTVACDVSPDAFDTSPDDPMASDQLAPCFGPRHYDPGWRFG